MFPTIHISGASLSSRNCNQNHLKISGPLMIAVPQMIPDHRTGKGRLAIKFGNVSIQEFGQWIYNLCNRFFITVKLRKPGTFEFDSRKLIWLGKNHKKVQDTRENLKTTTNKPLSIYQYFNIDPRLSAQNCVLKALEPCYDIDISNVAYYRWCLRCSFLTLFLATQ